MNEEELARLVVRLVGDTESYQQMFTAAAEKAGEMERASRKLGAAEKATAEAIRMGAEVTRQAESASEKYARQAREVKSLLDQQAISQTTANRTMKQARKAYFEAGNAATQYGRSIMSAGRAGMFRVTAPIVGIGVAAVAAGSSIETAFAGVQKTVNASEEQLQGLKSEFEDFITQGNAPFDMTELLGAAETAGQLGIKFENIVGFAKTVKNLELATNLGDAAGESLARIANITGLPQTQFENLGSTIVALGNNSAATESDIVDMTLRLGAAGRIIGLTVPQTTAFAASLASVGINAEAGGTAFSKLFVDMARQVATGGKNLAAFAKTAGMSVDEFSEKFRVDAAGAVKSLLTGLSQLDGAGAIQAMDAMGISEQRMTDAILRSAGAVDLMTDSMDLADRAFAENTALAAEAEVRYDSFAGIVKNAWAQLGLLGAEIFTTVRPALVTGIRWLTATVGAFMELDGATKAFIVGVAIAAAAIPPLMVAIGGLITLAGTTSIAYATLTGGSIALSAAAGVLSVSTGTLTMSTVALNAALAASPYAAIAIAVTALVGTIGALALAHADLNNELEKSGDLNQELIQLNQKRAKSAMDEAVAAGVGGDAEGGKLIAKDALENSKSELQGLQSQWRKAQEEFDTQIPIWGSLSGSAAVAKQELEEIKARVLAKRDEIKALEEGIANFDAAVAEAATVPAQSAPEAPVMPTESQQMAGQNVETIQKFEQQYQTLGMTEIQKTIFDIEVRADELEAAGQDAAELRGQITALQGLEAAIEIKTNALQVAETIKNKMADLKQAIGAIGLEGVELQLFNLENLGATKEQLDQIKPLLEEFQAKSEAFKAAEKQKADAEKLIEQYLPPKEKFEKRQAELQAMLDKGLIDKSTYESAVKDAEKQLKELEGQTKKDYSVDLSVKGIDAVEADSAEAMARVREYFATRIPRPDVPSIPGLPADSPAPQAPPTPQAAVAAGEITAPSMPPLDTLLFDEAKIKQQIENIEATMAKTDSAFRLVRLEESLDIAKGKAAELRAIIDGIGGSADVSVAGDISQTTQTISDVFVDTGESLRTEEPPIVPTPAISDISSNGTFFGMKPGQGLPSVPEVASNPDGVTPQRGLPVQTVPDPRIPGIDNVGSNAQQWADAISSINSEALSVENASAAMDAMLIARQSELRQAPTAPDMPPIQSRQSAAYVPLNLNPQRRPSVADAPPESPTAPAPYVPLNLNPQRAPESFSRDVRNSQRPELATPATLGVQSMPDIPDSPRLPRTTREQKIAESQAQKLDSRIANVRASIAGTDSGFRKDRLAESLEKLIARQSELRQPPSGQTIDTNLNLQGASQVQEYVPLNLNSQRSPSVADAPPELPTAPTPYVPLNLNPQRVPESLSRDVLNSQRPELATPATFGVKSVPDIPDSPRLPRTTREQTIAESQAQKLDGRIANVRASIAGTDSEFRKDRLAESLEKLIARQSELRQSPSPDATSQSVQSNEPTPQERAETANSNRITPATDRDREPLLRVAVATEQLLALQQNRPLIELQPSGLGR